METVRQCDCSRQPVVSAQPKGRRPCYQFCSTVLYSCYIPEKGYTREWINQRLQAIQVRKELTDEWDDRGIKKGQETLF
ncbi:MAG: hypothetical protein FNP40_03005 [Dehalobacter sp. 4CP]|nr:hypothetical protein [Dehalobacter sp. 4CP]